MGTRDLFLPKEVTGDFMAYFRFKSGRGIQQDGLAGGYAQGNYVCVGADS